MKTMLVHALPIVLRWWQQHLLQVHREGHVVHDCAVLRQLIDRLHQQLLVEAMCRADRPLMASYHSVQSHRLVPASYWERVALYRCTHCNEAVEAHAHGKGVSREGCLSEPDGFVAHESSQQGPYTATSISKVHAFQSCTVPPDQVSTIQNSSKLATGCASLRGKRARRSTRNPAVVFGKGLCS